MCAAVFRFLEGCSRARNRSSGRRQRQTAARCARSHSRTRHTPKCTARAADLCSRCRSRTFISPATAAAAAPLIIRNDTPQFPFNNHQVGARSVADDLHECNFEKAFLTFCGENGVCMRKRNARARQPAIVPLSRPAERKSPALRQPKNEFCVPILKSVFIYVVVAALEVNAMRDARALICSAVRFN